MPLKLGTSGLVGGYLGTNPIIKMYKGNDLVFQLSKEPSFIIPSFVPDTAETGLVINRAVLTGDSKPYEVTADGNGNLFILGNSSDNDRNGLQNPTVVDETKKIFYIPSSIHTVTHYALNNLQNIYPNLTNLVIGEGVVSLKDTSLSWNNSTTGSPLTDVLPKLVLPKSLKKINTITKFHIKEFNAKLYDYWYYGAKTYVSAPFNGCRIDVVYANSPLLEVDQTTNDSSPVSGQVGAGLYNGFEKCYVQEISRIGSYQFKYIDFNHLEFDNNITELGQYAFTNCDLHFKELTIPKNIKNFGGSSLKLATGMDIIFEHSNSDEITFGLVSNQGPFYNKTAYNLNVYTDNDYIRNWDWLKNDNATVTFYHLNGTAW